ncbi:hypothetical protein CLAFUW4_04998 [Fulvia fulva]|uniref:Uncharacterized protein n=1 Tax=Passalora fulva TaxID=5499 RepID=A0A9Q8PIT4_PASFU|nr:uncharacterized protein CLAFUR5_11909 [Fulvia fulva]KAK4626330.1 hypothetical protein CLAFUR4_04984 [Fulvia fulva]KAK4627762.1 hypothetical protein CLAFUR0_04988 [Fulvia fulva]UJO23180.1 hypothetical protein CLAFUR5_11909 [Fulvia fulva]WPV14374.1 hypothetical protein CLAFUW4_04998 [Fulvia fulva]WPV28984.1 hypothetical protein CLAFUW7_04992 [Fulvia fulva]
MADRVQAVRVACIGESSLDCIHTKQYSTYNIQTDHEIFSTGEFSLLTSLTGVPFLPMKLRPSLLTTSVMQNDRARGLQRNIKYGHAAEGKYFENPVARTLMACNEDGGARWTQRVGSVLIARADRKPLNEGHVAIMLGFIDNATQSIQENQDTSGAALSPDAFKAYYDYAMQHLLASDQADEWAKVPSMFADPAQTDDGVKMEVDGGVTV